MDIYLHEHNNNQLAVFVIKFTMLMSITSILAEKCLAIQTDEQANDKCDRA